MADVHDVHDDDLHEESSTGYKLSQPKQSLATYQQMVRSRSVSLIVPAPPPPSPHHGRLDGKSTVVATEADICELLRRLSFITSPRPFDAYDLALTSLDDNIAVPTCAYAPLSSNYYTLISASPPAPLYTQAPQASQMSQMPQMPQIVHTPETPKLTCTYTDAGDESLQRYKESLGLGGGKDLSDPNDPRVCIIHSLAMETPGRAPVVIDLSVPGTESTLRDHPFTIKEGSRFTMVATFKVQHEVLSGLRYVQVVKRKGIRVSKDSEMIGSYAPSTDKQPLYTKRFQEDEAPSGMLARGHYNAESSFVDDDKKTHLSFEWSFNIAKDW